MLASLMPVGLMLVGLMLVRLMLGGLMLGGLNETMPSRGRIGAREPCDSVRPRARISVDRWWEIASDPVRGFYRFQRRGAGGWSLGPVW